MKDWVNQVHARLDAWGEKLHEKEIRIPVDLTVGILFFLFSLGILFVMPQQVVVSEKDVVNGRAFPTLLMVVMMICCGMLVAKELYKLFTKQPLNWKVINLQTELKALAILAILVITYLLCRFTNLFVIGAVFCCLGFLVYFRCKKPSYYVITLTLAVVIWACFRFVLNVEF
nr:tripartite tricarboxylate transporter TctB family protein [uncultured Dysosmobacter sp.]